ncbi:MFS transporter [uncultured Pseudoteredinibacter sp.]|uniref:NTP/NDP exchange transporter n=1 Tax=uncultured Pseudoteredinibacter sp. TaxID=1641701 RepID=UPI00262E7DB5|nr:MFS transporter [uncultured Pseudoteredinibacter sp.]
MNSIKKNIYSLTLMRPHEQKPALAAFLMALMLMASYFILRPVRDAMASDWSDSELSMLWNIQFFLATGVIALYGVAASRMKLKHLAPIIYVFFSASFALFYVFSPRLEDPVLLEKGFYLWVTVFSLLNLSVFWSFLSTIFTKSQSKRLFPFISAGASAGAILGPTIPLFFSAIIGLDKLMLLAALTLILAIPFALYLIQGNNNSEESTPPTDINRVAGGTWWKGFSDVFSNRYLLYIAAFILLYVFLNSFMYFQQKNILAEFSRVQRTQILGGIDWVVNLLTFVFAFALTSRMIKYLGMGRTLSSIPVLMFLSMLLLALAPWVTILLAVQVARRVGNYSITRPAREMLFTEVSYEERIKAKPVIDVVIYRGGDAVSGSIFALLSDGIGLGLAAISCIAAAIAACWATLGSMLGRLYEHTNSIEKNNLEPSHSLDQNSPFQSEPQR